MAYAGLNGADPRPVRLVIFGESIVSDWGNPAATPWRALFRELRTAGHDAVFLERRKNDAVVALLRARGGAAMRAFGRAYPDLLNRTYDLPRGAERSVWFGREVSTADAAVMLDDAPPEIFEELSAYDTPRLVKVLARTGKKVPLPVPEDRFDLVLPDEVCSAVAITPGMPPDERSGVLVVAYGDAEAANAVALALSELRPELITPGDLPEPWRYQPEAGLPDTYARARLAVVVGRPADPGFAVRALLPMASGCPTLVATPPGDDIPSNLPHSIATRDSVAAAAAGLLDRYAAPTVPPAFDASRFAADIVERVRRTRAERMGLIVPA